MSDTCITAEDREAASGVQKIVSRPQFTARHTLSGGCEFQSHSHTAFTVTTILAGEMRVAIGETVYHLSKDDVALTNIRQNHSGHARNVEFVSVSISPPHVEELVTELGLTRTTAEIIFATSVVTDEAINKIARSIANEIAGERVGHEAMLDALVRQLVIHLLRSHMTVRKSARIELSRAGPVDRRLRLALEFMHDNFSRELALDEIASAAYLSEYHFARLFKHIMGVTPHTYIANLRLERARKLLSENSFPISEIAAMVGYQSQSHFTKIFKSVSGMTPRAYREALTAIRR